MKFPGLEQTLKDLESEIDSINMLHKNWWLAADGIPSCLGKAGVPVYAASCRPPSVSECGGQGQAESP